MAQKTKQDDETDDIKNSEIAYTERRPDMPEERRRERDLILAPNEYAYILDETKGNVINYVGPHKTSLANTDQPVVFNYDTKCFERCHLEDAIRVFAIAPEGWYLVLKNPACDGKPPRVGTANNLADLDIGRKVNIPGPVAFAPWPGQMIRVVQGHRLRSNQYLVVRVYDEEAARSNWGKAVIKPQKHTPGEEGGVSEAPAAEAAAVKPDLDVPDLTVGKLLIIKGIAVSFYIPPTGVEVVRDAEDQYVREAVTLERLEYCILLDEDGNKRYIRGPAVVFPRPTETFVLRNNTRKFRAIELNEISGLYIKVIAPYEEDGKKYKVGEELFITGREQMIYFPRPEHAIIRYGEGSVHYAVAIPAGEARYVLDRLTGQISLKRGPCMFLPDPRKEVIVRRVLSPKNVSLWFPGSQEALEYNRRLMELTSKEQGAYVQDRDAKQLFAKRSMAEVESEERAVESVIGDEFTRRQSFTQPRTITLDTKYEGAVVIMIWTGYAVLVVSKRGTRQVVVGPATYLLEYDETLGVLELSTGTPKNDQHLIKTVYLRMLHNKVSDSVTVETRDFCTVALHLSYRVNFEGDPNEWFNVENYVKFLTDHMRSVLNHAVRKYGIEEFYANAIAIIRDTVLGSAGEDSKRPGRVFSENGMRIYDVEVLNVAIDDEYMSELLVESQHTVVRQALDLAAEQRNRDFTTEKELIAQQVAGAKSATLQAALDLQMAEVKKQRDLSLAKVASEVTVRQKQLEAQRAEQDSLDAINTAEIAREQAQANADLSIAQQHLAQRLEELRAEVQAVVDKGGAISPHLVAALQSFSDKALAESMAESMAPLAILGGKSVAEVLAQLLKGTVLEQVLTRRAIAPEAEEPAE